MKPVLDIAGASLAGAGPLLQLSGIYDLGQVTDPAGDLSGAIAATAKGGHDWMTLLVMALLGVLGALKAMAPTIHERALRKSADAAAQRAELAAASAHAREIELMKLRGGTDAVAPDLADAADR